MNSYLHVLRERRKLLQNPYAFLDELDEFDALRRDRFRLENPYAHLDEVTRAAGPVGRFDGIDQPKQEKKNRNGRQKRSDALLEKIVRDIHIDLWARREDLFGKRDLDPIAILDPATALRHYGYRVIEEDSLGSYSAPDGVFQVAATIDKNLNEVHVSRQFMSSTLPFTLAHELGHAFLHETSGLHRDRPLDGSKAIGDQDEREANRFAALFLMPSRHVQRILEENLGFSPVRVDERELLKGKMPRYGDVRRAAARHIAGLTQFNGFGFTSLADRFKVSVEAMAIRLEELDLFVLSGNMGR